MSNNLLKNIKHQTLIIGDEPLMDQLKSNSSSHIHFLGNCSNPWKVIPINSLLVSFSYSEGMPNSVLEALTRGTPVLLSDIPEHRKSKVYLTQMFLLKITILLILG